MKKYNNSRRNGGFSLVELIIVIAIMAALVAVLAPQYIKYIEKSRITADQATLDEYIKAVQVAVSDETTVWGPGSIALSVATDGKVTATYTASPAVSGETLTSTVNTALGNKTLVLKSTTGKGLGTSTLSITIGSDGNVKWNGYPATWS